MSEDTPLNRRKFFRRGLGEFLRPLLQAIDPIEKVAQHVGSLEEQLSRHDYVAPAYTPPPPQYWLRPPGALAEQQFKDTCSRCGECQRVCPAYAIKLDYSYMEGEGLPYIKADESACVLCDGLLCMQTCPSGALVPTPKEQIKMGLAVWNQDQCVRTSGSPCSLCVDQCPIREAAIRLVDNRIEVIAAGCTGCGVCQHACPTYPKSIVVKPRAQTEAEQATQ